MQDRNVQPIAILLAAILLMIALHLVWPVTKFIPALWNLLGLAPIALGVWLNLSADRQFHAADTTVKSFAESSALMMDGVFGITRNPMYLGFVMLVAGITVLMRSATPWIVVIAFAAVMDRMYIRVEEQMLAETFGNTWESYRKQVGRWL